MATLTRLQKKLRRMQQALARQQQTQSGPAAALKLLDDDDLRTLGPGELVRRYQEALRAAEGGAVRSSPGSH